MLPNSSEWVPPERHLTERPGRPIAGRRTRRSIAAIAACLAAVQSSCTTLDSAPDIDDAAALVGERGPSADWSWPWDVAHESWDGRAPLSAEHAARLALVNNRSIRAALERIAVARADLVQAGLLPNPVLTVALGFPIDGGGGPVSVGAGLSQQIGALWLRGDRERVADAALRREILLVSDEALELVRTVRRAHAAVFFAERELGLRREQSDLLDRLVELMGARRDVGETSTLEFNRVALQRIAFRASLMESQGRVERSRLALLGLIGRGAGGLDFDVVPPTALIDHRQGDVGGIDVEEQLVDLALRQRLDVRAAQVGVSVAESGVYLERRRRIGGASGGVEFERDNDGRQELGPAMAMEIPLWDTNDAAIARAEALQRQAIIEADRIRELAVVAVRHAWRELTWAEQARSRYADEVLPAAEAHLNLVRQVLAAGEVDTATLIEAQREVVEAALRLNAVELHTVEAGIDLERVVGGFVPIVRP